MSHVVTLFSVSGIKDGHIYVASCVNPDKYICERHKETVIVFNHLCCGQRFITNWVFTWFGVGIESADSLAAKSSQSLYKWSYFKGDRAAWITRSEMRPFGIIAHCLFHEIVMHVQQHDYVLDSLAPWQLELAPCQSKGSSVYN